MNILVDILLLSLHSKISRSKIQLLTNDYNICHLDFSVCRKLFYFLFFYYCHGKGYILKANSSRLLWKHLTIHENRIVKNKEYLIIILIINYYVN